MTDGSAHTESDVKTLDVGDVAVAYRQQGEGPQVAFIHGLAQDMAMWDSQQTALSDFTTFALDVRGHGRTPVGEGDGTLEQLGNDLVGFLEQVGPADCVGHSLGGTLALWAASERPDLVPAAVASGTSSVVGRSAAAFYAQRLELFESGSDQDIAEALREDTRGMLHSPQVDLDRLVDSRLETIHDRRGYLNGARAMAGLHEHPLNDRLETIQAPVLVVRGEYDQFCPWRAAEIMLEHLPHGEYRELEGVGHCPTDEDPDLFAQAVGDWLRERMPS